MDNKTIRLAFFTALAVSIYVLENFIPKPLPFMKLGLANVIVLILLWRREYGAAAIVAVAKIVIGGLFSGTLVSPTSLLALAGTLTSFAIMCLLVYSNIKFSIVGISIAGAVFHNFGQLILVRIVLIQQQAIFKILPYLILLGIITGIITGYIAYILNIKLKYNKLEI
ncbi:MAG: Gx transporter family protein [Candidatus Cloacimonadota bacterium]|nr:Gx transporter family protein [Candidatus Cloacimonadota bacterium]